MDMNGVGSATSAAVTASTASYTKEASTAKETTKAYEEPAAVYEKSGDKKADKATAKSNQTDRSAIVAKLKADSDRRMSQLVDIVRQTIGKQGQTIGKADDMWKFLASGDFTVDAATKAQAQADIADDGYWGVDQTSDRIVDFAKALSNDDPDKAQQMIDAFKKGFSQATKAWGSKLPDISQRTYDAVMEKFDAWKNGEKTEA